MSLYLDSFHPVPMHIMKTLRSLFVIGLLTTSLSYQAMAANNATNNQAKIDLVKKVYLSKVDLGSLNTIVLPRLNYKKSSDNSINSTQISVSNPIWRWDVTCRYITTWDLVRIILTTSIKPCKSRTLLPIPSGQHLNNLTAIGSVQISR